MLALTLRILSKCSSAIKKVCQVCVSAVWLPNMFLCAAQKFSVFSLSAKDGSSQSGIVPVSESPLKSPKVYLRGDLGRTNAVCFVYAVFLRAIYMYHDRMPVAQIQFTFNHVLDNFIGEHRRKMLIRNL